MADHEGWKRLRAAASRGEIDRQFIYQGDGYEYVDIAEDSAGQGDSEWIQFSTAVEVYRRQKGSTAGFEFVKRYRHRRELTKPHSPGPA